MSTYEINKGIGKAVEFQGLKAQYIFYLAGGLIGLFMFFIVLRFLEVDAMISIPLVAALGGGLVYYIFYLNKKYGQHGLMKLMARKRRPFYMINFGYKESAFFQIHQKRNLNHAKTN